jgi:pimeloyl-ACP methyl ester carboxylesterase
MMTAVRTYEGAFPSGARYLIQAPADWNETLMLFCPGFAWEPGQPLAMGINPVIGDWLLKNGYALGRASYSSPGFWALEYAFREQMEVLDAFERLVGRPRRTIPWGFSQGGIITAGLLQLHPERFAGAMPLCGALAGGVGVRNENLDSAFVFKTLLAPDSALEVARITAPRRNLERALSILAEAQRTASGRARVALAAAAGNIPGWFSPTEPEPAADDFVARQQNQARWFEEIVFSIFFAARQVLEGRAGGNPSWNTGVDYREQLAKSTSSNGVEALYAAAGLDLNADLERLAAAPRIEADPAAVEYQARHIIFDGDLGGVPVLTLHTTGDGLVTVDNERAYGDVVERAGQQGLLRQLFVNRGGHCGFTVAETITAFQSLIRRINSGSWPADRCAEALNAAAAALGPEYNRFPSGQPAAPQFRDFTPPEFLRPYDRRTAADSG